MLLSINLDVNILESKMLGFLKENLLGFAKIFKLRLVGFQFIYNVLLYYIYVHLIY